jgi:hypothetical protein
MLSAVNELVALVPPLSGGSARIDWTTIEESVGLRLPSDYKAIVEAYGPGVFDDFLWVLQPLATNPNLDLLRQKENRLDALRVLAASGDTIPYRIDSDGGGYSLGPLPTMATHALG